MCAAETSFRTRPNYFIKHDLDFSIKKNYLKKCCNFISLIFIRGSRFDLQFGKCESFVLCASSIKFHNNDDD